MNRMIKGSIVGTAGVALLMGGFGTYATWTDDAVMGDQSVKAGALEITSDEGVAWDGNGQWSEGDDIVPGDEITRTESFTIEATGANMAGELELTVGDETNPFGDELDIAVAVTTEQAGLSGSLADGWTFDAPLGESFVVDTEVTFTFNDLGVGNNSNALQRATATLAGSTFVISQVRPTPVAP